MNEDNEFYRPYKKLQAVQDQQEQNLLVDIYASHWKNKFKSMPIFPVSNSHFTQMKDFRRAAGPNAALLVEHYFTMKDDWFIKQAYSLDCLVKNLNKVNASFGTLQHSKSNSNQMSIKIGCDACWEILELSVPINFDFNRPVRCVTCVDHGKSIRHTTKAERTAAVVKFGETFVGLKA